jgi:GntR family uxuAB operon transcriptional repressor
MKKSSNVKLDNVLKSNGNENERQRARRQQDEIELFLRAEIGNKSLAAGDRLPAERELAKKFSATRSVVRGALTTLTAEGLLRRRTGSGTYVNGVPARMAGGSIVADQVSPSDVLEARRVLEVGYLDLVVARATETDFQKMEVELRAMENAADQQSFRQAGYRFQLCVAEASRNALVIAMQRQIMETRTAIGWSTMPTLNDTQELRQDQIKHQRQVLAALRARDAHRAANIAAAELSKMIAMIIAPQR